MIQEWTAHYDGEVMEAGWEITVSTLSASSPSRLAFDLSPTTRTSAHLRWIFPLDLIYKTFQKYVQRWVSKLTININCLKPTQTKAPSSSAVSVSGDPGALWRWCNHLYADALEILFLIREIRTMPAVYILVDITVFFSVVYITQYWSLIKVYIGVQPH